MMIIPLIFGAALVQVLDVRVPHEMQAVVLLCVILYATKESRACLVLE